MNPINLYASCEIKAIAVKGDAKSEVSSAEYHDAEYPNIVKVGDIITANIINNGEENLPMIFKVTSVYPFNVEMENKEDYVEGWSNKDKLSGDIEIPSLVKNEGISYNVIGLGKDALALVVNVTSLKLNEGLEYTSYQSIRWCGGLHEIVIPNTVKVLGEAAMTDCHNVKTVVLGSGLERLKSLAFWAVSYRLETIVSLNPIPAICDSPNSTFESLP